MIYMNALSVTTGYWTTKIVNNTKFESEVKGTTLFLQNPIEALRNVLVKVLLFSLHTHILRLTSLRGQALGVADCTVPLCLAKF